MPSLSPGFSPNSISPAAKAWMAMLTGKPWPRCSSHLDLRLQLGEVPFDVLLQHNQALAVAKLVGGNVNSLSKVLTSPKTGKSFSLVQLFDQWEEGYQVRKHSSTCETRWLKQLKSRYIDRTRSSWLNCALRDDEGVYWVSIGHYEAVAVRNRWW